MKAHETSAENATGELEKLCQFLNLSDGQREAILEQVEEFNPVEPLSRLVQEISSVLENSEEGVKDFLSFAFGLYVNHYDSGSGIQATIDESTRFSRGGGFTLIQPNAYKDTEISNYKSETEIPYKTETRAPYWKAERIRYPSKRGGISSLFTEFQRKFAEVQEEWHEEGFQPVLPSTSANAKTLVTNLARALLDTEFPLPRLLPNPDGSISLDWVEPTFRLLIIMPPGTGTQPGLVHLYGEDREKRSPIDFKGPSSIITELVTAWFRMIL